MPRNAAFAPRSGASTPWSAALVRLCAVVLILVVLTAPAARAFSERAQTVVAAGRPPCQFCGNPLDPAGHLCPRANGFRRR